MKKWMLAPLALVFVLAASCAKHTTPRKVNKTLPEGYWKITNFTIEGESVAENYSTYSFGFGESGGIIVKGDGFSSSGSWETGLDKNPCILYLSFPPEGGLEYIADDWQVSEIKKDVITLKRNDESSSSNLTLKR